MKPTTNIDEIKALHHAGRLQEAKAAYLTLLAEFPQHKEALHLLALLCAEEGDMQASETYLEQAFAVAPSDVALQLHLANVYKAQNKYDEALQLLQKVIAEQPKNAAAYNNAGTIYFAQQAFTEAAQAFEKATDLQPEYVDAYYNLGLALNKLGRLVDAQAAFTAVLELAPDHPGAHFQSALTLMNQKKFLPAIAHLHKIIANFPYHLESHINLATCYLHLADLEQAKKHYLQALDIHSDDSQVLFNLGVISMQQQHPHAAIDYYSRAAKLEPHNFAVQNNLGFIHLMLKHQEDALLHFQKALAIAPDNEAIRHTIRILTQDNKIADSPPDYVRALFDSYADHFDEHLIKHLHYRGPKLLRDALLKVKNAEPHAWSILDLGCGTGLCGEVLRPFAKELIGIDLSANMLEIAAQKKLYDQLVQAAILPYLQTQQAAFDVIIAGDAFVYTGDLAAIFKNVYTALKSGGVVVFNVEISEDDDYKLMSSGRFAHSKSYIDRLIHENHFDIKHYERAASRSQDGKPVLVHVYVLAKVE